MANAVLLKHAKKAHHVANHAQVLNANTNYYHTSTWRRLRLAKLLEQPLCERCLEMGRTTLATDVHHIRPFLDYLDEETRWYMFKDYDNLMSLCEKCHHEIHKQLNKDKSSSKKGN